jgi:ribosomal protein S18 acetylase RimI-like enzyme
MICFTTIKFDEEIYEVIALQKINLPQSLSQEQMDSQGFVTVVHSFTTLKKMNDTEASIIAKDDDKVIGYLLAMTNASRNDIPILIPMFGAFDDVVYHGKKIAAFHYIVVGQVCVAEGYRGIGILDNCYDTYKEHFKNKYDFAITEINKNNKRSIRAHARIGFELVHSYKDATGNEWDIVIWDWMKEY